ncbi:MAG: transcriptional repressor LexA [Verrucomicrobia bacterium]|nr:transcriptional repressor LexA [Verrucomicrobiota bacterium]
MNEALTDPQRRILDFIHDCVRRSGRPPTVREICAHFGFRSTGTARDHVNALRAKGVLEHRPHETRGLHPARPVHALPLLGVVAAGQPVMSDENVEGFVNLAAPFQGQRNGRTFCLRVRGDSMVGDGIFEGDISVVRSQSTAASGDLVVALVDNEATMKRLVQRAGRKWLEAANPKYKPIPLTETARIIGRVIGILRSYEGKVNVIPA